MCRDMRSRCLRSIVAAFALSALIMLGGLASGALANTLVEGGVNLDALSPTEVSRASTLGAHWLRVFAPWPDLEPSPGVHSAYWFGAYDELIASLPKADHLIIDFVDTPAWESGSSAPNAPPANPADYARILHYMAERWAGKVAAYEIWNEEDATLWWAGAPDPAAYTRLLQAAYPAVKSADPTAKVVIGGLTGNDYYYLQTLYEAGAKGYFDAIGVHTDTACSVASPYAILRDANGRLDPDSFLGYREVHATELANGDDKPIWMTEMSWRTTDAECSEGVSAGKKPEGVSDATQATYLAEAYHCLSEDSYVQVGLYDPGDDGRYSGRLRIRVKATDSQGIERIRLLDDGHLIRNFDPYFHIHVFPRSYVAEMHWYGAKKISVGRHVLTILAYDKLMNVTSYHVSFVHLPEPKRRHHR
jgi:hypothetical protein